MFLCLIYWNYCIFTACPMVVLYIIIQSWWWLVRSHAKRRWMSPSATPATQNKGRCRQVPRLPRKTKVYVTKCHACHVKRRHTSPSATPATQSAAASPATNPVQARHQSQPSALSTTPATQNEVVCERWCVTKLWKMVCDKVVCVTGLQVPSLPRVPRLPRKVPRRHRQGCVWQMVWDWQSCVCDK